MGEFLDFFKIKKNLANLLILGILVLAIPLGVNLVRQQQILKSRADTPPIVFSGPNVKTINNKIVATKPEVTLEITAPGDSGSGGDSVQTKCAGIMLWSQIDAELKVAKYDGLYDHSQTELDAYNEIRVCESGAGKVSFLQDTLMSLVPKGLVGTVYAQSGGCTLYYCTDSNPCTEDICRDELFELGAGSSPQCFYSSKPAGTDCEFNYSGGSATVTKKCDSAGQCSVPVDGSGTPGSNQVCTPGSFDRHCSGQNAGCGITAGELVVKQCNSAGTGWGDTKGECSSDCKPSTTGPGSGTCSADIEKARQALNQSGGSFQNATCDQIKNKVCTDCNIFVPPNSIRDAFCPGTCSSSGACSVSNWTFSNNNPPPNTLIKATVKGVSSSSWSNIVYKKDSEGWVTSKVDVTDGPTFSFDVNSGNAGSHNVTLGINNGTGACTPTGSFTTGGSANIASFRVSEDPTDWSSAPRPYNGPAAKVPWSFKDKKPGIKTIFVQFYDKDGKQIGERRQASIDLLGGNPVISGCSLSFEGSSVVFTVSGSNFGADKGAMTSESADLEIKNWSPTQIKASLANPETGQSFPITVTNSFGQEASGLCSAISQLSLGAKVFCRAPSSHDTDNVDLALKEATAGGKTVKQKVKIDKDGVIRELNTNLENGKAYKLSLKAPRSLRKTITFTAGDGATNIPDFVLPVGDIFPLDGGNGAIDIFDMSELYRQWIISQDALGRSGDFNQDSRVNSIDWSCMRHDFGKSDDPEP